MIKLTLTSGAVVYAAPSLIELLIPNGSGTDVMLSDNQLTVKETPAQIITLMGGPAATGT